MTPEGKRKIIDSEAIERQIAEGERLQDERMASGWRDPNSLCLWYPKIEPVVPTPKTAWVDFDLRWMFPIFDGHPPLPQCDEAIARLCEQGNNIGWPCFFRTDLCSGKHDWLSTCYTPDSDAAKRNVRPLIEYGEMTSFAGLPVTALVVREFLRAESPFTCYQGFPMTLERRVFVRDGEVLCDHPYWPKEAVAQGRPTDLDWEAKFDALYATYGAAHERTVRDLASKAGKAVGGYWSVDFLLAKGSAGYGWYLTDMARGEDSYHYDWCPVAAARAKGGE